MEYTDLVVPKKLRESETGVKLSSLEYDFIRTLSTEPYQHLLKRLTRTNAPYEGSEYKSDFVLMLPGYDRWRGVSIELQGGIHQGSNKKGGKRSGPRTGHTSAAGIIRDYKKTILAQLNGFFFMPVAGGDESLVGAAELLDNIYMQYREYLATAADKPEVECQTVDVSVPEDEAHTSSMVPTYRPVVLSR